MFARASICLNTSSLHFSVGSYLCVFVCMYLNTTALIVTTLGSYFTIYNEEVDCVKSNLKLHRANLLINNPPVAIKTSTAEVWLTGS